ncbi:hypothetical protein U8P76_30690 (plasmid) [Rhizobium johnstonii]|nr:hypothetical protein U8P76_30690 [Rhizobium johnstonii]
MVEPIVDKIAKSITYRIRLKGTKDEIDRAKSGTAAGKRQGFICPFSGTPISYDYIRKAGQDGKMREEMLAIIAEGSRGRIFLDPDTMHSEIANSESPDWRPETKLHGKTRVNVSNYGLDTYGDLFLNRQLVALNTFGDLVKEARDVALRDASTLLGENDGQRLRDGGTGATAYADALAVYLGFVVSSQADRMSTICTWDAGGPTWGTKTRNTFSRQAIPMSWDFTETNPFSTQSGSFGNSLDYTSKGVTSNAASNGSITQIDARHIDPGQQCVISTDPPYYDNIGYADLSDFFYVWLKKICGEVFPNIFGLIATPKADELIAAPYRHGGKDEAEAYFLQGMTEAISRMVSLSPDGFPATIYYAFKQSEIADEGISSTGWATFLQAVIEAGFAVVGTWPMRTELANRLIASGTNALANSVVLVCRKKESAAEIITRAEFIRALKRELPPAIAELQAANIAPADMPQSAIGPGMGVFSRYKAVLESDDSPMTVKAALQLINRELDEYLRAVVLGVAHSHTGRGGSDAHTEAKDILMQRGSTPRVYRNMLVFLAAEQRQLDNLNSAMRSALAWAEIVKQTDRLNLTQSDEALAKSKVAEANETLRTRMKEAWCYLLYPVQDTAQADLTWTSAKIPAQDGLLARASKKLVSDEGLFPEFGPARLDRELQKYIWNDKSHLSLKDLAEYLSRYGENIVLEAAIGPGNILSVVSSTPPGSVKGWARAQVYVEGEKFCHESCGTFFAQEGAMKAHCMAIGAPYEHYGESIDDYC